MPNSRAMNTEVMIRDSVDIDAFHSPVSANTAKVARTNRDTRHPATRQETSTPMTVTPSQVNAFRTWLISTTADPSPTEM